MEVDLKFQPAVQWFFVESLKQRKRVLTYRIIFVSSILLQNTLYFR